VTVAPSPWDVTRLITVTARYTVTNDSALHLLIKQCGTNAEVMYYTTSIIVTAALANVSSLRHVVLRCSGSCSLHTYDTIVHSTALKAASNM
jgi:hypothetical protein